MRNRSKTRTSTPPTGPQLRAARAALGWSTEELADRARVSKRTIYRYECAEGVPVHRGFILSTLVSCLERGGVEFIRSRDGVPGILIKAASQSRKEPS